MVVGVVGVLIFVCVGVVVDICIFFSLLSLSFYSSIFFFFPLLLSHSDLMEVGRRKISKRMNKGLKILSLLLVLNHYSSPTLNPRNSL
jgi:hypothetical protein